MSEQHTYAAKHLTRIMVLLLKKKFPDHFAALPMQTLMKWLPDERDDVAPFWGMTVGEVESLTGIDAGILSCWTCLSKQVSQEEMKILMAASDADLWRVIEEWEQARGDAETWTTDLACVFAPGFGCFADRITAIRSSGSRKMPSRQSTAS